MRTTSQSCLHPSHPQVQIPALSKLSRSASTHQIRISSVRWGRKRARSSGAGGSYRGSCPARSDGLDGDVKSEKRIDFFTYPRTPPSLLPSLDLSPASAPHSKTGPARLSQIAAPTAIASIASSPHPCTSNCQWLSMPSYTLWSPTGYPSP